MSLRSLLLLASLYLASGFSVHGAACRRSPAAALADVQMAVGLQSVS
jgi:hypothetical protein